MKKKHEGWQLFISKFFLRKQEKRTISFWNQKNWAHSEGQQKQQHIIIIITDFGIQ